MPANRHAALLAVLLAALFTATLLPRAVAETWRCGNTYTDHPCEGGRPMATEDRRDSAQQRNADAMARRAQSAADRMAQERLQREQSVAGRQAVLIAEPPEPASPKKPQDAKASARGGKKQRTASAHFTAQGPGTGVKSTGVKSAGVKKKAATKTASTDKP